jgi:hypothetical protein
MLDDGDKAIIEKISFGAAEHVAESVRENTRILLQAQAQEIASAKSLADRALSEASAHASQELKTHALECPIARELTAIKNKLVGAYALAVIVAAVLAWGIQVAVSLIHK